MEKATEQKTSRQEQILDAAFSLAATNGNWSLSDIAGSIGVSKTALYRHFKNRAEIEEAMDERLFRQIRDTIEKAGPTVAGVRNAAAEYLRDNQGALLRLLHKFSLSYEFPLSLVEYLKKESPVASLFFAETARLPPERRSLRETALVKNIVSVLIASLRVDGIRKIQDELLEVLSTGFREICQPDETRLDELEAVSEISGSELREGNRLIDAIAASIREHGITKTTIGTIAEKMGTAKSSLYFYSKNKRSMIEDLVANEMRTIAELSTDRARRGTTIAEQIFIIMMVQANYLIMKPDILPVFNWIRYETIKQNPKTMQGHAELCKNLEPYRIDEVFHGQENSRESGASLLKWASILSTSCVIHGVARHQDKRALRHDIRLMFRDMMAGDKGM